MAINRKNIEMKRAKKVDCSLHRNALAIKFGGAIDGWLTTKLRTRRGITHYSVHLYTWINSFVGISVVFCLEMAKAFKREFEWTPWARLIRFKYRCRSLESPSRAQRSPASTTFTSHHSSHRRAKCLTKKKKCGLYNFRALRRALSFGDSFRLLYPYFIGASCVGRV